MLPDDAVAGEKRRWALLAVTVAALRGGSGRVEQLAGVNYTDGTYTVDQDEAKGLRTVLYTDKDSFVAAVQVYARRLLGR